MTEFFGSLIGAAIGSAGVFWFMEAYYSRKEWREGDRWED